MEEMSYTMMEAYTIFVMLVLLVAVILTPIFCIKISKYNKLVEANSDLIKNMKDLNARTKFNTNIQTKYSFATTCNSKRQIDKLNLTDYFVTFIENNIEYFSNIFSLIMTNIRTYELYKKEYLNLKSTITNERCVSLKTNIDKFQRYEKKIFNKLIKMPIMDLNIKLKAIYTTPVKRNKYWKEKYYNFNDFKTIFIYTKQQIATKQTRQYQIKLERAKLTDSIRYDVLRRDNFKCQICGSSANDGVKLHVDHIIPVSKGGQTVMKNLRTLCDRCNLGKRDKIE